MREIATEITFPGHGYQDAAGPLRASSSGTLPTGLSAGVDYSLYEYDWFQDSEREDVWTYSIGARWRVSECTDLRARLSYEEDRFREYTTLDVSVTVRF